MLFACVSCQGNTIPTSFQDAESGTVASNRRHNLPVPYNIASNFGLVHECTGSGCKLTVSLFTSGLEVGHKQLAAQGSGFRGDRRSTPLLLKEERASSTIGSANLASTLSE